MASKLKKTHKLVASGKDQENKIRTIEPSSNIEENIKVTRKRKASVDRERDTKRHCRSSRNLDPCQPGNVPTEDVRVRPNKRRASPERQTPQKRHRGSSQTTDTQPINVFVSEVRKKRGKRKASADLEIPVKRQRVGSEAKAVATPTNTSKSQVLVEDIKAGQGSTGTGGETPGRRKEGSELGQRSNQSTLSNLNTSRANFEAKYQQLSKLGAGGFGTVYAGVRIADALPVAIKHIQGPGVESELKEHKIPQEVVLMQKVSGGPESVGKCASVSLLDWYYLDNEVILVMERPVPCMDLSRYLQAKGGSLEEHEAKIIMTQIVKATMEIHGKGVFHGDIKCENILADISSSIPRVRMIDFGCGHFVQKDLSRPKHDTFALAYSKWLGWREADAVATTVWQLGMLLYRLLHGSRFDTMNFLIGNLPFSSKLSQACHDFLHLCLTLPARKRGTLQQLQHHPWLKQSNLSN